MEELWEAALSSDVADNWSRFDRSTFYCFVARVKQMVAVLHQSIPGYTALDE